MAKVRFVWKAGLQAGLVAVAAIAGATWLVLSRTQNADHHELRILTSQTVSLASEATVLESLHRGGKLLPIFASQHARQLHDHADDLHKKIAKTRTAEPLSAPKRELEATAAQLTATLSAAPAVDEAAFVLLQQRADAIDERLPRDPP